MKVPVDGKLQNLGVLQHPHGSTYLSTALIYLAWSKHYPGIQSHGIKCDHVTEWGDSNGQIKSFTDLPGEIHIIYFGLISVYTSTSIVCKLRPPLVFYPTVLSQHESPCSLSCSLALGELMEMVIIYSKIQSKFQSTVQSMVQSKFRVHDAAFTPIYPLE